VAFPLDRGGWSWKLDALPLADAEGRVSGIMKEPTEREPRRDTQDDRPTGGGTGNMDDEIPFAPEFR
jgi:hypothetical protein